MLRRLFVKETFEHIEEELKAIYQALGIEEGTLKIKKQSATYSKPYEYTVEGMLQNHRFVLGLWQSPLKEQAHQQQLELIIQCENPKWTTLVLEKKNVLESTAKKILGIAPITPLKNVNLDRLILYSNDQEWTRALFDVAMGKKISIMDEIKFSSFVLERKRLHVKMPWLPDNFSKRQAFIQLLDFSIDFIKKVDARE